jgi:hypothetical protein
MEIKNKKVKIVKTVKDNSQNLQKETKGTLI